MTQQNDKRRGPPKGANRMPEDSVFYDRMVPIILLTLGAVTVGLILVAAGILLGVI